MHSLDRWRADTCVLVGPLREWYETEYREGPRALARALGWTTRQGKADSQRVRRALGIAPTSTAGKRYYRQQIGYDNAVRLAEAMGADPVTVGL